MRAHAVGVEIFEMVGRQRAEAGGQRGAAEVRELLGVDLHRQAEVAGGGEDARAPAPGVKAMPSQKASTASTSPSACGGAQRRDADLVDVGVGVEPVGHGVGAEEGGAHPDRPRAADLAGDAQHAELGLAVEPVARLDLERRRPPRRSARRRAGSAPASSAAASAARVARTVETMPPPARAISS